MFNENYIVISLALFVIFAIASAIYVFITIIFDRTGRSGEWIVKNKPKKLHECDKPYKYSFGDGSIWKCKCGIVWKLEHQELFPMWKELDNDIQRE